MKQCKNGMQNYSYRFFEIAGFVHACIIIIDQMKPVCIFSLGICISGNNIYAYSFVTWTCGHINGILGSNEKH